MNKKKIALVLATVIVLMQLSVALAVPVPQAPTHERVSLLTELDAFGNAKESFTIELGHTSPKAEKELMSIRDFITKQEATPIDYFGDEVKMETADLLPSGYNLGNLEIDEFLSMDAVIEGDVGDTIVALDCAVKYAKGQAVVAIIGAYKGEDENGEPIIEWIACRTEIVDGQVYVHIPQDVVYVVNQEEAILTIMSDKYITKTVIVEETVVVKPTATPAPIKSKTTEDMAKVVSYFAADGSTELDADFDVMIITHTETATVELERVRNFVENERSPVARFFGNDIADTLKAKLPAALSEAGIDALMMNEFAPMNAYNYKEELGDVVTDFAFATEYDEGQFVSALVGIAMGVDAMGEPIVEWTLLEAQVTQEGLVRVLLTRDCLLKILDHDAMIAILSEPMTH